MESRIRNRIRVGEEREGELLLKIFAAPKRTAQLGLAGRLRGTLASTL